MATKKKTPVVENESAVSVIDPLYKKYVKSVVRALGTTEFYEYFMESVAQAENEIQFSNRRMEKLVDTNWIDAIENALTGFQNIIASPRNVIREDELIVNVANAKKTGSDVVRHLAVHTSLVEDFNEENGDVRPSKLMQKYREDSIGQVYENRVVFTTLEMAYQFVKIRHDALFEAMSDEFGAKLKVKTDMTSSNEFVHMDTFIHIRDVDNALDTDDKNREVFERISRLYRILATNMNSHFARHMAKYPRVKGTVTKTNVLKKNKNYHAVMELMEFLRGYGDIGYTIKIIEQNPVVDDAFQKDIFHNVLFNYLVLKGHLERDKDRRLPAPVKEKKRSLKPKFIKEIIEELTEDYDLPDVEIRKVLIEELTKEQLMREEAAERRRLVEEQEKRKKEEEQRIKREKEEEKERLRREREEEKERLRLEQEAEKQKQLIERMEREQEDRRRSKLFRTELEHFAKYFEERLQARLEKEQSEIVAQQDFEDAAYILEDTERLKQEELERARIRRREERERQQREELDARQKALAEEAERLEKVRLEKLAEEERLKLQLEEQEEAPRIERYMQDLLAVESYAREISDFRKNISERVKLRKDAAEKLLSEQRAREAERRKLIDARSKKRNKRIGKI